ncbi:MAG: hypothetical protein NTX15_08175 [Candidatus Kapabacteria bacterium]|nr:hypothetical protein [Candidatus Kapabacteria bacterium]
MEIISLLHAKMLHLLYLLAALSILFPLINTVRKQQLNAVSIWTVRVYMVAISIQLVLGIVQLVSKWSDLGDGLRFRLEHAFIMLLAVACVHVTPRFIKRRDAIGARNTTFVMIASLALIILGATLIKTALKS